MPRPALLPPTLPKPRRFTVRGALAAAVLLSSGAAHATTVGPLTELATPMTSQRAPTVSWDAGNNVYVIVWEDRRNVGSTGIDLYLARLQADGTLIDTMGFPLLDPSASADDEVQPSIVYNSDTGTHMVAWNEARTGLSDIFATRILAGAPTGTPSVIPTAGIQISSGTDSESSPVVAVSDSLTQTFLVAYQTNIDGGGRVVRGRRLYPSGSFLDDAPIDLSTPGGGAPAVIGKNNDFYLAFVNNGDVFLRSLPDFGTVPGASGATTPVSTATLSQSRISLGLLGANLMAVWQDNRAFSTLEADIFGRRFDDSGMMIDAEGPVSTGTAAQQFPKFAGGANGGLAVWQDRRFSTSNAIIFGARIDAATGQTLDPKGFPVLALPANAFEPAVTKGPMNDFLVAGVKFDASAPRVYYRIVRDELPGGSPMSVMGNDPTPADGVTVAQLDFFPAVGDSGLDVVDGTLYTINLSQTGIDIVQPDADPNLPGHQLESADGRLLVRLRTIEHVMVDVTATSVEGTSSGTAQIEFLNVPPVVSNVTVGPASPRSVEPLNLAYTYSDVNLDPEDTMRRRVQWTANAQLKGAYQNQVTIPPNATVKGERWQAQITPHDGLDSGTPVFSNFVIIRNTPPEALDVRIVLDNAVTVARTGTGMRGSYIYDDADGDAETGSEIRWYDRGAEQVDLRDQDLVPSDRVLKGQQWSFTVRPSDGDPDEGFGALVGSATVTVVNTKPVAAAQPEVEEVTERRRFTLDGTASSDVDPQDTLQFTWRQVIQGTEPEVQLSSTSSATPSFMAPSVESRTIVFFELVVSDGEETSDPETYVVNILALPDPDADLLDDEEEAELGTNPMVADTDRDGLRDGEEVKGIRMAGQFLPVGTDPLDEDTDDDGVRDGAEGRTTKNGTDYDVRGDPDGDQIINALDPDSDDDGISDGTELSIRNPLRGGSSDGFDYAGTDESAGFFVADADPETSTNPNAPDTDMDTLRDGDEDTNKNGRVDDGETDPLDPEDPGIDCSSQACPDGFTCVDGTCRVGEPDGGIMCTPLPETRECCMGTCADGTFVEPECRRQGAMESCPVGAVACPVGACSVPDVPQPEPSGCSASGAQPSVLALLGFAALALLRRRRR